MCATTKFSPKLSPLTRRMLNLEQHVEEAACVEETKPQKRMKLWELEEKYHCPIVGTCVPLAELTKFARRFEFNAALNEEFCLHVEAVSYSRSRNNFSETLQRHLDRKYRLTLQQFQQQKTDAEVLKQWQECLARGEVAAPMWAVLTHKAASAETRHRVFTDIHMLSHQVGAGQAADSRRLEYLEKQNAELKRDQHNALRGAQRRISELTTRNAEIERDLLKLNGVVNELTTTKAQLSSYETGQVMVDMGRRLMALQEANAQLISAAQQTWKLEKSLKAAHQECARFAGERDEAVQERESLLLLLSKLEPKEESKEGACAMQAGEDCQHCEQPMDARCILYVGGRVSMIAQYRQLAERLGIRFVHHDGGQEESLSRLPELIHGADAVVCPTDNISHSAYYQVKTHCKRVGKPCLFYEGSGVSSFALAMNKVSRGEFSLSGASSIPASIPISLYENER